MDQCLMACQNLCIKHPEFFPSLGKDEEGDPDVGAIDAMVKDAPVPMSVEQFVAWFQSTFLK